jgi:shikimate kinase
MRLSFIGMSGIGKSYWSAKLAEQGFKRFCCDDLIAEKLATELTGPAGTAIPMGEWMGFPYEAKYIVREALYLHYEIEVMNEILAYLESSYDQPKDKVVIDTTGSVIYTGGDILERLKRQTKIIYLYAPMAVQEKMRLAYVANPAPVLWGDKFERKSGESNEAALARCYPELLAYRASMYEQWSDVHIDYETLRRDDFSLDEFLKLVNTAEP